MLRNQSRAFMSGAGGELNNFDFLQSLPVPVPKIDFEANDPRAGEISRAGADQPAPQY